MVALAEWIESEQMPSAAENRVGDFFGSQPESVGKTAPQVVDRDWEKKAVGYDSPRGYVLPQKKNDDERKKRCDELKELLKAENLDAFKEKLKDNVTVFGDFDRLSLDFHSLGAEGGGLGMALANRAINGGHSYFNQGSNAYYWPRHDFFSLDFNDGLYDATFSSSDEASVFSATVLGHELGHGWVGILSENDNSVLVENRIARAFRSNGLDERIRESYGTDLISPSGENIAKLNNFMKEWGCE